MATVVGAVLVAAIAVAGLILYRTTFVPVEEEKAEHRFAAAVAERLLEVRTDLDDHLARPGTGALTTPVPVAQGPSGPLAPPRPPNTIAFDDDEQTVTVHAPTARFAERNGTSVVQTAATWVEFTGTGTVVRDITGVRDLWVKLDEVGSGQDGEAARVRVFDRDGFAGQLRAVVLRPGPPGQDFYELRIQVQNAAGDTIFDQPVLASEEAIQDYRLRATEPSLAFDQVLAAAEPPMRLIFTENPLDASRSMTWTETNRSSGATTVRADGGPVVEPFHRETLSGTLRYESRNVHFVDQTYRVEHGAILLSQRDGVAVRVPPELAVGRVGDRTVVDLPVPTLDGPDASLSGRSTIAVSTTAVAREEIRLLADRVSVNVTTTAPSAWSDVWNGSVADAGLPASAWSVQTGTDWVNATISGIDPGARDVDLHLRQATIRTIMER